MRGLVTIVVLVMLLIGVFFLGYNTGVDAECNRNFETSTPFNDIFGYKPEEVVKGTFEVISVDGDCVTIEGTMQTKVQGWEYTSYQASFPEHSK